MNVYHLLFCGIFVPSVLGQTRFGSHGYTKYERGDMNIIITASHGGRLTPLRQANGDDWPDRKNGCKDEFENCIYTHSCSSANKDCPARTLRDRNTKEIAQDLADKIKEITGNGQILNNNSNEMMHFFLRWNVWVSGWRLLRVLDGGYNRSVFRCIYYALEKETTSYYGCLYPLKM